MEVIGVVSDNSALEWQGFDVDRGAEMTMVNMEDIQKSDMGGGSVPGEVDGIPTVELFKEITEGDGT